MTSRQGSLVARTIVAIAGAALLAVSVAPKGAAESGLPRFERGDCLMNGDWALDVRRECGWLVVAESRDRPSANTVRLALEVFRATEASGAPPVVELHGGPGGPGAIRPMSEGVAMLTRPRQYRDVVLYDQRGAGFSEPKLCRAYESVADSVHNLLKGAEKEGKLREARRACIAELERKGIDRLAYNTAASVADLIDLRRVLGYVSWDIHADSYGARLAQEAMVRDRQAVRSVVLHSPVGRSFWFEAEQPLSTQRAFERLFAACNRQPSCRHAFPTVEQDFYTVYTELTKSPLMVPIQLPDGRGETVRVDGNRLFADMVERIGPKISELGRLPLLLHELRAGDRLRAAREVVGDGSRPIGFGDRALHQLITCYDNYGPTYLKTLVSVNASARPPFRRAVARECEEWLPRFDDESTRTPVRSSIPTLILTGHFDDRTPTELARRIASTLSRAYLVELPDEGHGGGPPNPCVLAILTQFWEDPTRKPDTSCVSTIPPIAFATTWGPAKAP